MDNSFNIILLLDAISNTVICLFLKISFNVGNVNDHVQLLTEHEHVAGSRLLYGLQKIYRANYSHLHMMGSLPHTVHLTYKQFLLVSLSPSLEI
jgi:hypothetical protein